MSAYTVAMIGALIDSHRELIPVLEEHLEDNEGQVLPHLVMADIIRWLVGHYASQPQVSHDVLAWLEKAFIRGPDEVQGLIAVSGVEVIPDPGKPGAELRELLGPRLREVDPWRR
jgi:hypothetical protein